MKWMHHLFSPFSVNIIQSILCVRRVMIKLMFEVVVDAAAVAVK